LVAPSGLPLGSSPGRFGPTARGPGTLANPLPMNSLVVSLQQPDDPAGKRAVVGGLTSGTQGGGGPGERPRSHSPNRRAVSEAAMPGSGVNKGGPPPSGRNAQPRHFGLLTHPPEGRTGASGSQPVFGRWRARPARPPACSGLATERAGSHPTRDRIRPHPFRRSANQLGGPVAACAVGDRATRIAPRCSKAPRRERARCCAPAKPGSAQVQSVAYNVRWTAVAS
jgi:hypothetical protein